MKRLFCNLETCLGCRSCEIACAVEHSKSKGLLLAIGEKPLPKQRIFLQSAPAVERPRAPEGQEGFMPVLGGQAEFKPYPLQCRHCDEPLCVLACMSAVIHKEEETGIVTIDEDRCVGCGMCIMACPFGALIMDRERKVSLKCDHCVESEEPACIKACPTKSLFYGELEEFKSQLVKK